MRKLVIVSSHHHRNTEKVARAMADALGAEVRRPGEVDPAEVRGCDLVGFGSGIDSDHHYQAILDLADALLPASGKKAFIFSTTGLPAFAAGEGSIARYAAKSHAALRGKLVAKGYAIVGEFSCPGFNTNSFLKFFGGLNKGRPHAGDLRRAGAFARTMAECTK